jgi:hypothetical protein
MTEAKRVHIDGAPTPQQALALHHELFPEAGIYRVQQLDHLDDLILKAQAGEDSEPFEVWFLRELDHVTEQHFVNARLAIWEVLERLLHERGLTAPSQMAYWHLNEALFDLTTSSTARMVGLYVPADLVARLQALHFTLPEALDFPALAYRMGLIYRRLAEATPTAWPELMQLANQVPLSSVERLAVEHTRLRAGVWLRPIFDETGRVWTAAREIEPLRVIQREALEQRRSVREAARQLDNSQRARGVLRDAERVMRTEIAEARGRGAWQAGLAGTGPETKFVRTTSTRACRDCLRLYRNPDGTPRLYTRAQLEEFDRLGPNRGPREKWHITLGVTHPHCACAPWLEWHPAMQRIAKESAPRFAAVMRDLGIAA